MDDGIPIRDTKASGNLTNSEATLTQGIDELVDFGLLGFHLTFPLGLD
jgi:hypothetical protein